jgi:hypothetical protein
MLVTDTDFIKEPSLYLEKIEAESVHITKDGRTIAVLAKPGYTQITDSLLGLLKDSGIRGKDDIKAMKVRV